MATDTYPPVLLERLTQAAAALAAELGQGSLVFVRSPSPTDNTVEATAYAGVIGFADTRMRGFMTVCASRDFLAGTYPRAGTGNQMAVKEQHLRDWAGELANQLLGRLKNLLLPFNVSFQLGTPTVVGGKDLNVSAHAETPLVAYRAQGSVGTLTIIFSATLDPTIDWLHEQATDDTVKEGDGLFF